MSHNARPGGDPAEDALLDDIEAAAQEELEREEELIGEGAGQAEAPDEVELLASEVADLKDRNLRLVAEMENLRRRAEREKAEATLFAATNFARDILPVGDNLARALESVDEQTRANAPDGFKNLLEGIELTQRELLNTLEKHNISVIDPIGEKFDPNMHQAMFEVPNPDVVNKTVVQVVQVGYRIGDRVLRPAMVGVAKSDKKASSTEEPAPDS